jgi:predicted nucleic acid-binding protein
MFDKPKVYLDTSVISHLFQDEKPEAKGYTLEFWEKIKNGEFEVFISQVVLDEIGKASDEKNKLMMEAVNEIPYNFELITGYTYNLAEEIIHQRILPARCFDDCMHIAASITSNCNFLATWNIKHLANFKTNNGIRTLFLANRETPLQIVPPSFLIGGFYDTETDNK